MKVTYRHFFSIPAMMALTGIIVIAIGTATFIENDFGAETARAVVYSALWFRIVLVLLAICLAGSIVQNRLWQREKWFSMVFHASFLIILMGGGITTFFGFEGTMHIREGDVSRMMLSNQKYLRMNIRDDTTMIERERPLLLSRITGNAFKETVEWDDRQAVVRYRDFIADAVPEMTEDENGVPMLSLQVSEDEQPQIVILEDGRAVRTSRAVFSFNRTVEDTLPVVTFRLTENGVFFSSTQEIRKTPMSGGRPILIRAGRNVLLEHLTLYALPDVQFALKRVVWAGRIRAVPADEQNRPVKERTDALVVKLHVGDEVREASLFDRIDQKGESRVLNIDGLEVSLSYGAKEIVLPFGLELVDFLLERYPGSRKPSSFISKVVVIDPNKGIRRPHRITMNHILKHGGFRFYQESYDDDEQGTVLSVSRDPGMVVVYAGIVLLIVGLTANLFAPSSRFRKLNKKAVDTVSKTSVFTILILFFTLLAATSAEARQQSPEAVRPAWKVDDNHSRLFGTLLVLDDGRIKPVNSLAQEFLRDVSRADRLRGLDPERIVIGMFAVPEVWQYFPMILTDDRAVNRLLGIDLQRKYATFFEVWDPAPGTTRLNDYVQAISQKPIRIRDHIEKEIMKVHERAMRCRDVYTGRIFKVFPDPNDPHRSWTDFTTVMHVVADSIMPEPARLAQDYIQTLKTALRNGEWERATEALGEIKIYQQQVGKAIVPSQARVRTEILYNAFRPFRRVIPVYAFGGLILLLLSVLHFWKRPPIIGLLVKITAGVICIGFIVHTAGFVLRWIASGYAPWSNKYESMVFVGWATCLAGLLFYRRSTVPLALSGVFTGLILMAAHAPGVDPGIAPLAPVLKSYWLVVHVSVIASSYGFLGSGALLALFTLLLFVIRNKRTEGVIESSIGEFTRLGEQTLIVGLTLLTIGNFLGAMWANESWGRYWGWDPKETWSLITILVYAIVIHWRIYKPADTFTYNGMALLAYGCVLMTYLGVNAYLSGLHSYAQGDPAPVPAGIWIALTLLMIVIGLAWRGKRGDRS